MPEPTLFSAPDDELLISVYQKQARTLDDLPYTPQFEAICEAVGANASNADRAELFHRLHNLRKAARLPRLGKAAGRTGGPRIDRAHEQLLQQLVEANLGRISLRDQLPYTDAFDRIVNEFNNQAGLAISAHDAWRLVAKLAK